MAVSIQEYDQIKNDSNCARFFHTNLHVHTPAVAWDWNAYSNQTTDAALVTPEIYFEQLNNTTLEVVAITDHNSVKWCKTLIDLAKKSRKLKQSKLHILPGVEITTYEGPHIIAIFDEDKDITSIELMLFRLGLTGEGGKDEKVGNKSTTPLTIMTLLDEVEKEQGLIIAPHVDSKDGLWGNDAFRGRTDLLNDSRLRILAVASEEIKRVEENDRVRLLYKNMDSEKIENSFAFINVSDCHRMDDFEKNTTWIKMSVPNLNGIRQLIFEPELRLAHDVTVSPKKVKYPKSIKFRNNPVDCSHNHILGIAITGGMLDGEIIGLSPHQNSIIGRNYAGKSALLDCIRFTFNSTPKYLESALYDDPYFKFINRLRAILGIGSQVRIYVHISGETYCISRVFTCTKIGGSSDKEKWRLEGIPEIYNLLNGEFHRETDLSLDDLFIPEIYPQGEVVRIKDNANQQMKIIDALANTKDRITQLTIDEISGNKTLLGIIKQNAKDILSITAKRDELPQLFENMDQLDEEIKSLELLVESEQYLELKKWGTLENFISGIKHQFVGVNQIWNSMKPFEFNFQGNEERQEGEDDQIIDLSIAPPEQYEKILRSKYQTLINNLNLLKKSSEKELTTFQSFLDEIEKTREIRELAVKDTLVGSSAGGKNDIGSSLLDRITEKRDSLNEKRRKESEYKELDEQLIALRKVRDDLLSKYREEWNNLRDSRRKVTLQIDKNSAENIHVRLIEGDEKFQFRKLLDEIVDHISSSTAKIQNRQSQLDSIVAAVAPLELLSLVQKGDVDHFCRSIPGVMQNTARLLIGIGLADQLSLEQCVVDDKFQVCFRKEGESEFTPIDSGLSGGEQALALISVAMVHKEIPLIIDQPEDELGPALITKDLVDQIRNVKKDRQLIFVTHIPNIPVLADSEQIIYISQEFENQTKRSKIMHKGSLDQEDIVARLLELDGGKSAFIKRSERYKSLVSKRKN